MGFKVKREDLLDSQRNILSNVVNNTLDKNFKGHMTISGPAGTGKTLLTKFIYRDLLEEFTPEEILLAAPTHQAKKVLNSSLGVDIASTIHSILRINPETHEDIETFSQIETPDLTNVKVLICDEVSMYGDDLFRILIDSIPSGCTIIGIGDPYQIQPTKNDELVGDQISRFFTSKGFKQYALTEVVRNDSKIIEVATGIRNGSDLFPNNSGSGSGVYQAKSLKEFMDMYFSIVKTHHDFEDHRILAYTNSAVDRFNSIARKVIYKTEEPYIVGETIVLQQPIIKTITENKKKRQVIVMNNGENASILDINKTDEEFHIPSTKDRITIKFWALKIKSLDQSSKEPEVIKVIVDQNEQKRLDQFLALFASTCRKIKMNGGYPPWTTFWKIKGTFTNIKALPASTIHKSQGTTNETTFLYTPCMELNRQFLTPRQIQELKYVGATRPKSKLIYL